MRTLDCENCGNTIELPKDGDYVPVSCTTCGMVIEAPPSWRWFDGQSQHGIRPVSMEREGVVGRIDPLGSVPEAGIAGNHWSFRWLEAFSVRFNPLWTYGAVHFAVFAVIAVAITESILLVLVR